MTRLLSASVLALSLLAAGTAAQAQSYTALGGIPAEAAQAAQAASSRSVAAPAVRQDVVTTGSLGRNTVHQSTASRR